MASNIAQFFSSINYQLLLLILNKASFDSKVSFLFSNYLIGKKNQYWWNDFISPLFHVDVDIDVGQGFVLSPILFALYFSPIFHIFEKISNNLNISILFLLFVDNGLLKCFGLVLEYGKSKNFYFYRLHRYSNPPPLNLSCFGKPILCPKDNWRYLRFIFNRKL